MARRKYTTRGGAPQLSKQLQEFDNILAQMDDAPLLKCLKAYRHTGRPGYPLQALWRAYVYSYFKGLPHTNALIRELQDRPDLRIFCGFEVLPSRYTFNRFINRLSYHTDLVEKTMAGITNELKQAIPDLGKEVAVDSTVVSSNSRPYRKDNEGTVLRESSDPEADWTAKNSARAKKDGKDWFWGYKLHMVADVNDGLPLAQFVTTASRNDSPELPNLIAKAEGLYDWFKPSAVIADRGYDAESNHHYLQDKEINPIIHIRRHPTKGNKNGWIDGVYTTDGEPTCIGQIPMKYVRTDPATGHRLYRCTGCHLKNSQRGGIRHCDTEVWEDPMSNIKLFGAGIRRGSPEWKALYGKRQGIERVFKSMKESRRLDSHCHRGLRKVSLHATMSALIYQATALANFQAGRPIGWMVRKVA